MAVAEVNEVKKNPSRNSYRYYLKFSETARYLYRLYVML